MKKLKEKIAGNLDLPLEISGKYRISIIEGEGIAVENHRGIIEYGEGLVKLRVHGGAVSICGRGFEISEIMDDSIMIRGEVMGIEME